MDEVVAVPDVFGDFVVVGLGGSATEGVVGKGDGLSVWAGDLGELSLGAPEVVPGGSVAEDLFGEEAVGVYCVLGAVGLLDDAAGAVTSVGFVLASEEVAGGVALSVEGFSAGEDLADEVASWVVLVLGGG
jgi:hypothetical protein